MAAASSDHGHDHHGGVGVWCEPPPAPFCLPVSPSVQYHIYHDLRPDSGYKVTVTQNNTSASFLVRTNRTERSASLAWRCNLEEACGDEGACFPATDGLVAPAQGGGNIQQQDDVPDDYPYTCRCLDDSCTPVLEDRVVESSTTLTTDEYMVITHADFSTNTSRLSPSATQSSYPGCVLPNALAILKYWCDGKHQCTIEYERLHSYLEESQVCRHNTDLEDFTLTVRLTQNTTSPVCQDELFFFNNTCFETHDPTDFESGRNICLQSGGDLASFINDSSFYNHWTEEWWTLGVEEGSTRTPRLFARTPDQAYVSGGNYIRCGEECSSKRLQVVCALPPVFRPLPRLTTSLLPPNDSCANNTCQNGATCFPASEALGLADPSFSTAMCRCPPGYTGLKCELQADNEEKLVVVNGGNYRFSTDDSLVWKVEFALFGRNASVNQTFSGCYAASALSLLRQKCDGRPSCEVSHEDLHNHLSSTCHPAVTPYLSLRLAKHSIYSEWRCSEDAASPDMTGGCLVVPDGNYSDPQEAKLACNAQGGDMALMSLYNSTVAVCPPDVGSVWVDAWDDANALAAFNMYVKVPDALNCTDRDDIDGQRSVLCEYPMVLEHNPPTEAPSTPIPTPSATTTNASTPSTVPSSTTTSTTVTTSTTSSTTIAASTTSSTTIAASTTSSTTIAASTTTPGPRRPCPECVPLPEVYPEYKWNQTEPGETRTQNCPDTSDANASWTCGSDGHWIDEPDLSACSNLQLEEWASALSDNSTNTTAGDILTDFVANTTSTNMAPGDVAGTVNLLEAAGERHRRDRQGLTDPDQILNVTSTYVSSVSLVVDRLLKQAQVWFGLPEAPRRRNCTVMQELLQSAVEEMAQLLDAQSKSYHRETVGVEAESFNRQHYADDNNRIYTHSNDSGSKIELLESLQQSGRTADQVAVTFMEFTTLQCVLGRGIICNPAGLQTALATGGVVYPLQEVVNGYIMGMTLNDTLRSVESPQGAADNPRVRITFRHIFSGDRYNLNGSSKLCVWWDPVSSSWSPDGCWLDSSSDYFSVCSCNHLTNFAIIMDINGIIDVNDPVLVLITDIGCGLSLVCLAAAVVTLVVMIRGRQVVSTTSVVIHLNLCCCLFVSTVVLLAGLDSTESKVGCAAVAAILHYLLLAYFCWMGVEGVCVYLLLVRVFRTATSPLPYYHAVAYGAPAIIVIISASISPEGYGTDSFCWLDPMDQGLIWAFAAPALVILLVNVVMFVLGVRVLVRQRESRSGGGKKEKKRKTLLLRRSVTLATVMGLTWLTGFLYFSQGTKALAVIFTLFSSLQGVMLFLVLVVVPPAPRACFLDLVFCRYFKFSRPQGRASIAANTLGLTHSNFSISETTPIDPRESSEFDFNTRDPQDPGADLAGDPPDFTPQPVPIDPRGSAELDIHVARDLKNLHTNWNPQDLRSNWGEENRRKNWDLLNRVRDAVSRRR
ncbi:latrophilin-like protein LAT-2 isoform X3 [Procambarus clarkii]|uniref:latrophilin-like protein LAT-2 isoform X3 n=1 Tax=Procambarus clarkii TaxID=6728 RepID=UPI003742EBE2